MDFRIISSAEEMEQIRPSWERLEQQDPDIAIYSTYEFVRAWWQSFGRKSSHRLHIVCVYHNNALVGIGPFVVVQRRRGPFRFKVLEFAGRGDYLNVLTDRALNPLTVTKYIFQALEETRAWDIIQLSYVSADSRLADYFFKSKENRFFQPLVENPHIVISDYSGFEHYARENLPAKVPQYRNKLKADEDFRFEVIRGNGQGVFEEIGALHRQEQEYLAAKMGRKERSSLYENRFVSDYVQAVFQGSADIITFVYRGRGGQLLGYKTGYLYKDVVYSWNGAYHPDYYRYRVGKILYYDILKYLFESNIACRYDFGAGRYQWKFEWTASFSTTYEFYKATTGLGKRLIRSRVILHAFRGGK